MEDLKGGTLALEHRYDVENDEGRISQALVYRATQKPFDRPVWVRVYDSIETSNEADSLTARIKESCREVSELTHDGVLRVVDYGEIGRGLPFVVSERCKGPALSDWLESQGTLGVDSVVQLVQRLADIVGKAHEMGMYHGSLGTHAVWVPGEAIDDARVAGFALGLTMSELRALEDAILSYDSLAPLAPEFFEDEDCEPSRRSDVYSLAAIAYTALGGVHPYFEDVTDTSEGLLRIKRGEVRELAELGVNEAISDVVMRGIAADPDERPSDVWHFASQLAEAAAPDTEPAEEEIEEFSEIDRSDDLIELPTEVHDQVEPTPGGTFIGLLVLFLILSNIGWLMWSSSAQKAVALPESTEREVLKRRVQISTDPDGAKVTKIGGGPEQELGLTPLLIDPAIGGGSVQVRLEKNGFEPMNVRIEEQEEDQQVVIDLLESP